MEKNQNNSVKNKSYELRSQLSTIKHTTNGVEKRIVEMMVKYFKVDERHTFTDSKCSEINKQDKSMTHIIVKQQEVNDKSKYLKQQDKKNQLAT